MRHLAPVAGSGSRARPSPVDRRLVAAVAAAAVVVAVAAVALLSGQDEPRRVAAPPGPSSTAGPGTTGPAATGGPDTAAQGAGSAPGTGSAPGNGAAPGSAAAPAPAERVPPAAVRAVLGQGRTASTMRTAYEQLLAGRAVANARVLHAELQDEGDLVPAAQAALASNTTDLTAVTRAVKGPAMAEELQRRYAQQSAAAQSYARAVHEGDRAAADAARAEMAASSGRLGDTLAKITGGAIGAGVPKEDAGKLRAYVDALAAGDHPRAYQLDRELHGRMSREGTVLATSMAGPALVAGQGAEQRALGSRWQLLFGEHAAMAGEVVRTGLTGAPEFPAAARALDANTGELAAAVGGALGPQAAQAFSARWADTVDAVVAYADATAKQDSAGKAAASSRLAASTSALAAFFSDTTGGRLSAESLQPVLQRHADQLARQADAWARGDFTGAYTLAAADYADLASLGLPTASAISAVVAERAPVGGAATGGSGPTATGALVGARR